MALLIGYYLLSIIGIIKKRSKLLTILMLAMMWIVFGLNTYNGDFGNYSWIYQNIQKPSYWAEFEPLYNVLMYICSILGLSFIQFRMVFGGIYLILLYIAISKYTENKAEVLGLYMLFPFLSFVAVIRSGFAGVLIVLAYHEIIADKNNKLKFWIYFIAACLIQYTSVLFVFYYFLRKKEFKKNSVLLVICILIGGFGAYYSGLLYRIVSLLTSSYRLLKWFIPQASGQEPRWILYLSILDLMCLVLAYLSRSENSISDKVWSARNPYSEDIFIISIAMLVFIPTFFVTNASIRFIWQFLLLIIICYAKDDECRFPNENIQRLGFSRKMILLLAVLIFFSYYSNLPYQGTENDGRLVFQNNLIYGEYDPN